MKIDKILHKLRPIFKQRLDSCDGFDYLYRYLTYGASPVLSKIKLGELLTLRFNRVCNRELWESSKNEILASFGLSCAELKVTDGAISIIIYDEKRLEDLLENPEVRQILNSFGYSLSSVSEVFSCLQRRMYESSFPHEIGLFLGYPPEDVKIFIEKGGREFVYCKYWKVYQDVERSLITFDQIDRAKAHALKLLLNTKSSVSQAVERLKAI